MTRDSFDDIFGKHFAPPTTPKQADEYEGSKRHFVDIAKSIYYFNRLGTKHSYNSDYHESKKAFAEQDAAQDRLGKYFKLKHGPFSTTEDILDSDDTEEEYKRLHDKHVIGPKLQESDEEEIQDIKQFFRTTKRTLHQKWNTLRGKETKRLSVNKWHADNPHLHHLSGEQALPVFQGHVHDTYGKSIDSNVQAKFVRHWNRLRSGKTTSVPITKGIYKEESMNEGKLSKTGIVAALLAAGLGEYHILIRPEIERQLADRDYKREKWKKSRAGHNHQMKMMRHLKAKYGDKVNIVGRPYPNITKRDPLKKAPSKVKKESAAIQKPQSSRRLRIMTENKDSFDDAFGKHFGAQPSNNIENERRKYFKAIAHKIKWAPNIHKALQVYGPQLKHFSYDMAEEEHNILVHGLWRDDKDFRDHDKVYDQYFSGQKDKRPIPWHGIVKDF